MIYLILFAILISCTISYEPCFQSQYCKCDFDASLLDCSRFTSFKQLNFSTNVTYKWSQLLLHPTNGLELNSDLNLSQLRFDSIRMSDIILFDASFNGFDVGNPNEIYIEKSKWKFQGKNSLFSNLNLKMFELRQVEFVDSMNANLLSNSTIQELSIINSLGTIKFEQVDEISFLKISVFKLTIADDKSIQTLTESSILNKQIFKSLQKIEVISTFISFIDSNVLQLFDSLFSLTLNNVRLKSLLLKDTKWLRNLNTNKIRSFKLELGDEIAEDFQFDDKDLCLFSEFSHENNVIPLIKNSLSVACSCTIYWLYKNYDSYKNTLTNDEKKMIPTQCLDINPSIIQEQQAFCQEHYSIDTCKTTNTQIMTKLSTSKIERVCFEAKYGCTCNYDSINYLECIGQVPSEFSNIKWNYVLFSQSSLDSLNGLNLATNATLKVKNVQTFGDFIFSQINFEEKFILVIENSSLNSLGFSAFANLNLSRFELNDCLMQQNIPITIFEGSFIDELVIDHPQPNGLLLQFSTNFLLQRKIQIKKFKINSFVADHGDNGYQPFGIDRFTLPLKIFQSLEELEILDTKIDFIESDSLKYIDTMQSLKLQNVNLTKIIEYDTQYGSSDENFLSNTNLKSLFLGREYKNNFTFPIENFCFFHKAHAQLKVYMYDSIDYIDGPQCTCSILRLYRDLIWSEIPTDPQRSYIPKCVLRLGSKESIQNELNNCLDGKTPEDYCNPSMSTLPLTSTSTDLFIFSSSTTTQNQNSSLVLKESSNNQTFLILISIAFIFIFSLTLGFILLIFKVTKMKKRIKKLSSESIKF